MGKDSWQAIPENVADTTRCTRLGSISTIEHMMSALAGLEITDAEIEVSAPELPAMDGSAKPFFDGLSSAGVETLGTSESGDLFSRVYVQDGEAKLAISAGQGHWRYEFHTGEKWPGVQVFETEDVRGVYGSKLSEARTFGFQEELPALLAAGLAKGLDTESALIIGEKGYLNGERFDDEPVRHKLLDAIGDIYLAGVPIRFLNVVAIRTGHTATVQAAKLLREQLAAVPATV